MVTPLSSPLVYCVKELVLVGTVGHSGSYNLYIGIAKQLAVNDSLWEGDLGHSTVGEACYLHSGRCWRMELRRDCSLIPRACFRMDHH